MSEKLIDKYFDGVNPLPEKVSQAIDDLVKTVKEAKIIPEEFDRNRGEKLIIKTASEWTEIIVEVTNEYTKEELAINDVGLREVMKLKRVGNLTEEQHKKINVVIRRLKNEHQ